VSNTDASRWSTELVSAAGSDAAQIIATAQAGCEPTVLDPTEIYTAVLPIGAVLNVLDLENKLDKPNRKRGSYVFWDAPSFAGYVNRHKSDATELFLDDRAPVLVGFLNGDSTTEAGWGDHAARLEFRRTDAWVRWLGLNEKFVGQAEFAEHIERNLVDIVEPKGADLLELAQTFQATTSAEFRSQKRLANGQRQFLYSENIEGKGGSNGQIEIPETFSLAIAAFEGGEEYPVKARLRFRLHAGDLRLGYVLDNPRDVERRAVADVAQAAASAIGLPALFGARSQGPSVAE
jgi:uncharacterized protein YfdQ (DUF2303 family)